MHYNQSVGSEEHKTHLLLSFFQMFIGKLFWLSRAILILKNKVSFATNILDIFVQPASISCFLLPRGFSARSANEKINYLTHGQIPAALGVTLRKK